MMTDQMPLTLEKELEEPLAPPVVSGPLSTAEPEPAPAACLSRRQFLMRSAALVGTVAVGDTISEVSHIEVTRHQVPLRGLREPMRVVQLSDLHRSWCVPESYIAHIVEMTNALKPDMIALTGDYISHSTDYVPSCATQIGKLKAPMGVYGILGNHDYAADDYHGGPVVAEALAYAGVNLVIDRNVRLENGVRLVGLNDITTQSVYIDDAFIGIAPGEPVITLTHNPQLWDGLFQKDCVTLTGHTHGGQINIPYITRLVHPDRSTYWKGWFSDSAHRGRLYVSRGLGTINIPLRFRSRPEISVFNFVPA